MPEVEKDEIWLPKDEAAALLKVGIRQLENRVTDGLIRKKVLPKAPSERVARVVFSREDLLALKAGKPNTHAEVGPVAVRHPNCSCGTGSLGACIVHSQAPAPANGVVAIPAALIELLRERREPVAVTMPGPFVGLADAVAISGMPASWLLAQARAGVPWAINVGTGKKAFWRFSIASGRAK